LDHAWQLTTPGKKQGAVMVRKSTMGSLQVIFARALRDENGGEIVETALILGLIVVVSMIVVKAFGINLGTRWNDIVELF
jgi:Flp pilus assembly pilin Flp